MRSATKKKTGKDPERLAFIRAQPCCVCANHIDNMDRPWQQNTKTEAAHLGPRGLSQKAPDGRAVPLCAYHHRGAGGSLHVVGPKVFWMLHALDPEQLIADYNERFDRGERAK